MATGTPTRERINSIDALRGLVMVLMVLDHARDFFGNIRLDPHDLTAETASAGLFFTRWITHFCAPVFVFLAGTSAYLRGARGGGRAELSRYLATRGLLLVVLEATAVQFGWSFYLVNVVFLQVIAAIGFAMIALAGLVWLPLGAVAVIGFAIACGHNLLDGIAPEDLGDWGWLWVLLHEGGFRPILTAPVLLLVIYPLLPWVGVIALGYAFGALMTRPQDERRRWCWRLGAGAVASFVVVRALGGYGNPWPAAPQNNLAMSVASFLNCQKYPPSLAFLTMTLGPALLVLGAFERPPGVVLRGLLTFGRVPLFLYLAHIYLLHLGCVVWRWLCHGTAVSPMVAAVSGSFPDPYPGDLTSTYVAWVATVALLLWPCAWFGRRKRAGHGAWWSYF